MRSKSKENFCVDLRNMTLDELRHTLTYYCGPHNVILARKEFGSLAPELMRLLNDEIALRMVDDILLGESL